MQLLFKTDFFQQLHHLFFHSSLARVKTFFLSQLGIDKVKGKTDYYFVVSFFFSVCVCVFFLTHSPSPVLSMRNSVFYCQIKTRRG